MNTNAFLRAIQLSSDDIWNGDGRGDERLKKMLDAIQALPESTTPERAEDLYWQIDNVAVIQGGVFLAGPKILPALLDGLFRATEVSRPYLLEAIYQIASGGVSPESSSIHERERIQGEMIRVVEGALRYFMHLAIHSSNADAMHALDLIALVVTTPDQPSLVTANYKQDMHSLLDALKEHPERYEVLNRNISG